MKKKSVKIILSLLSLFLVAVIAFFANAFFGNPVSKALAKNAAEKLRRVRIYAKPYTPKSASTENARA